MPIPKVLGVYAVYGWCGMRIGTVTEYGEKAALKVAQVMFPGAVGVDYLYETLNSDASDIMQEGNEDMIEGAGF